MSILDPTNRILQHVPRWTIIRTLRRQSVAEHSYYVTLYATFIAIELDLKTNDINWITQYALTHDFDEMVSGDIPTPYKRGTEYDDKLITKHSKKMGSTILINEPTDIRLCMEVVKVADEFEACMYLADEKAMGNSTIEPLLADIMWHLEKKAENLEEGLYKKLAEEIHKTTRTYLYSSKGL
tara:strand:+ start:8460 stop:9005 length:546 start_codon:yes stop_codon:yes gene_type:complete